MRCVGVIVGMAWTMLLGGHAQAAAQAKVQVVATLPTLAAIAQEVGGEWVEVRALAAPTEDPHFVDARPDLLVPLNRADLLVANGLQLEIGWLPTLQTAARNPHIACGAPGYVEVAHFVDLLGVPVGRVDRSMGDLHPGGNPHFLNSPRAAVQIARGLGRRLGEIDPPHAAAYKRSAEIFAQSVQRLGKEQAARFATFTPAQRQVVVYHQSLIYLTDWLGLSEAATLEPRPGVPPHPAHVAQVLSLMRQRQVPLVVQEEYYPTNNGKTLASLAQGTLVSLHGGVRFTQGERYGDYLSALADSIYAALAAHAG